jgi:hypothetical protein
MSAGRLAVRTGCRGQAGDNPLVIAQSDHARNRPTWAVASRRRHRTGGRQAESTCSATTSFYDIEKSVGPKRQAARIVETTRHDQSRRLRMDREGDGCQEREWECHYHET